MSFSFFVRLQRAAVIYRYSRISAPFHRGGRFAEIVPFTFVPTSCHYHAEAFQRECEDLT